MANSQMTPDEVRRQVNRIEFNKADTQAVSKFPKGKKASTGKKSGATGKESSFHGGPNSRSSRRG